MSSVRCTNWLVVLMGVNLLGGIGGGEQGQAAEGPKHRKLSAVPFTQVKVQDIFWAPRIETNRKVSLPHNFAWCEQTGRISNFAKAAKLMPGQFEGIYFNDSDVYKVLEGASYSLADLPDPELEKKVDEVIAKIAAAQQSDGYLNTYYTLKEPGKRWTNLKDMHELYCAGHLFEAAAAHYRATGKKTLLDVAVRFADHIESIFGPDKRRGVCGHEEVELALVKLYEVTGQEKYLKLAHFFLDIRGDEAKRQGRDNLFGPMFQDHKPVRQLDEVVGHAVRMMYLVCGMADVAAYTGDEGFIQALDRLWKDLTLYKMYITGGIGARHAGEAFGDRYELPNASAYCETCAAIGLALWAHRMALLHADAQYADVLERVLYNGFLSGVSLKGDRFFYVNPLESAGNHHRQPFYPCACCPTNVVRVLPSLPGYVYAVGPKDLYVNLYVASRAEISLAGSKLVVRQQTRYPWEGRVAITLEPQKEMDITIHCRLPGWTEGRPVRVQLDGQPVEKPQVQKGYLVFRRSWQPGDRIELDFPMEVDRIESHPLVEANRGRVAIQRGPIVYCFEAVDNGGRVRNIQLARQPEFQPHWKPDLLGGIVMISAKTRDGRTVRAIPYYAWDHREAGEMIVWVRQDGKTKKPRTDDPSWQGRLYRPLDPDSLGPSEPLTLMEMAEPSASFVGVGVLSALNDGLEPKNSCDHDIPRFTWWNHLGTKEWVQYDWSEPQIVRAVEVYWFDDEPLKRHCRTPQSWRLLYKEGQEWKPVLTKDSYGTEPNKYHRVQFEPVRTRALRIEVQLKPNWSGGILEWKVE
ncbi:MAG: glycoside hydrolase family 127 protein [Thermoguttaceae bacterium]|nr:glycoside hydrolase family 127 protein [Thermoguttaceae bacterium]MDW8039737.1 glycoside hydrolase family 127 protein [Thermoguttaceae bacterium]